MAELTPVEKRALKARAHTLVPVVLVGDKGLTGSVLAEIERALSAHELIKIRVQAEREGRGNILGEICAKTNASAIQHIGKVLVVYREKPPETPIKPARKPATRKSPDRSSGGKTTERPRFGEAPYARPRRPGTAPGRPPPRGTPRASGAPTSAKGASRGTGRPESRTASPRRAPARPPGRRRTSR